nr:hypothetical protein CFP56_30147 [Quercus suber]
MSVTRFLLKAVNVKAWIAGPRLPANADWISILLILFGPGILWLPPRDISSERGARGARRCQRQIASGSKGNAQWTRVLPQRLRSLISFPSPDGSRQ